MVSKSDDDSDRPDFEGDASLDDDPADALDRGLRIAFGGDDDAEPLFPASFKLRQTEPTDRMPGDFGLGVFPGAAEGRYRLGPELGRGGVGRVLKASDVDLGRELALKVLLEEHIANPAMTRRFVEEAQVAGQLQHPGIVPVHQLGKLDDGRLYFSMKLVRGKTLAELLAVRDGVEIDRQHFLGIYLKVCQTMAYAHARRVVHRDLKPGNIMVGSFGEVQVVDWGLAKVLPPLGVADIEEDSDLEPEVETLRSLQSAAASMAGTVMGTPSYMAPEQARGDVHRIDERTDVFGLGAILCEILTGRPPYEGQTSVEVRERAARGDIEAAVADIEACDADAEVCALAKRCLQVDPADRPRDAGEVARELERYLESLEDRARASELAAAEARGAAREERRARRLTTALAFVALVLVIGAAAFWVDRAHRRSGAETAVRDAVSRGDSIVAAAAAEHDLVALERGLDAMGYALEVAERGLVGPEVRAQVEQRHAELTRAVERARWVERLYHVREVHGDEPEWQTTAPEYDTLFREYGVDFALLPEEEIVRRLGESGIVEEFAVALDDWSRFLRRAERKRVAASPPGELGAFEWQSRARVARAIDPDPYRDRLRRAFENEDADELARLAIESALATPYEAVLLGSSLLELAATDEALIARAARLFERGAAKFSGDYWVLHGGGVAQLRFDPPRYEEAQPYFRAALALRPDSAHSAVELAGVCEALGQLDEAADYYRRAIASEPHFDRAKVLLARCLIASTHEPDSDGAGASLEAAVAGEATESTASIAEAKLWLEDAARGELAGIAITELAALARRTGAVDEALELAERAVDRAPDYAEAHAELARARALAGEVALARAAIEHAIDLEPTSAVYRNDLASFEVKRDEYRAALAALARAIELDPGFSLAHRSRGEAQQQIGQLFEAERAYRRAIELEPESARAWYKLGTVQQTLGDHAWIDAFARAHELGELDPEANMDMFTRLYNEGLTAHRQGAMTRAAPAFRVLLRLDAAALGIPGPTFRAIRYFAAVSFQAVGETEEALPVYEGILAESGPRDELRAFSACHAGQCLEQLGRFAEAVASFRRGLELCRETQSRMTSDAERWLARAERAVALGPDFDRYATGKQTPETVTDADVLARLAKSRGEPKAAARFYEVGLALLEDTTEPLPTRFPGAFRYAAAVAFIAHAEDRPTSPDEASEWRAKARDALERELAAWTPVAEEAPDPDNARERRTRLGFWLSDPTWDRYRDPAALAELDPAERIDWSRLWLEHARRLP